MDNQNDVLHAAASDAVTAIMDPKLSPQAVAAELVRQAEALPIHEAHRATVAQSITAFRDTATKLLRDLDFPGLRQAKIQFVNAIWQGGYTQAPPEKSQRELWRFRAQDLEWRSNFDVLLSWLQPGEKIIQMTKEAAQTSSGRVITLREVLLSQKPRNDGTPDDQWLASRRMG